MKIWNGERVSNKAFIKLTILDAQLLKGIIDYNEYCERADKIFESEEI